MARVFKATYTKMRTVKDRKGKVVYDVKNGKKVARRKHVLDENDKPVLAESRKWYVEYRDADGIVRRVPGFADKKATEQLAARLEREAAQRKTGLIDRHAEHRKRPLSEHLEEWEQALIAKGTTPHHATVQRTRAGAVLDGCGFRFWPEISASKAQEFVADLRKDAKDKRGISPRTANAYLQAVKQFGNWMVRDDRAPDSPLVNLSRYNEKTDRRRVRRALTEKECEGLLAAAEAGPVRYGVSGHDRATLYRIALGTGLRANEIRQLTAGDFALDATPPTVTVKACYSKHRREDVQPILPSLAAILRDHFRDSGDAEAAFLMPEKTNVARMLRADLKAAGIPNRDRSGHVVDFHALRHSYISLMARAGVAPKVLMDLARHSDINLTMGYYSHTVVSDRAEALTALPDLTGTPAQRRGLAATGTDDTAPLSTGFAGQNDKQNDKRANDDAQVTGPCRIRTYDQWIMSPLL